MDKEKIITDEMRTNYKELVETIGVGAVTLIHFIHYKEFMVDLDKLKQECQKELLIELKRKIKMSKFDSDDILEWIKLKNSDELE